MKNRITIVAGSVVSGWERGLKTIIMSLAENNRVDVFLEEPFAPIAARVLGENIRKIHLHVLGSRHRSFGEKILYVYSNTYPNIIILLYRPGISKGAYVDKGCIRVPREAIGAENIVKLANHGDAYIISIVRHCSNLGASLVNWTYLEECNCPSTDDGFKIDFAVYAPSISSIKRFLEEGKQWFL